MTTGETRPGRLDRWHDASIGRTIGTDDPNDYFIDEAMDDISDDSPIDDLLNRWSGRISDQERRRQAQLDDIFDRLDEITQLRPRIELRQLGDQVQRQVNDERYNDDDDHDDDDDDYASAVIDLTEAAEPGLSYDGLAEEFPDEVSDRVHEAPPPARPSEVKLRTAAPAVPSRTEMARPRLILTGLPDGAARPAAPAIAAAPATAPMQRPTPGEPPALSPLRRAGHVENRGALSSRLRHTAPAASPAKAEPEPGRPRQLRGLGPRQESLAEVAAARRAARTAEPMVERHFCEHCGMPARIDIHDQLRGRMHLSCHGCFRMWQIEVAPTFVGDSGPQMRD